MGTPLRTLLIAASEDDESLLERRLSQHGFEPHVERVWTAPAITQALARQEWDIVLCDIALAGLDAYTALEIVQSSGRAVPVIVVSEDPGEEAVVELMRRGAADYLSKDRLARLGPSVDQARARARAERDRVRAEGERQEFNRRFRAMLETIGLLAMTLDRSGRVTFCNDALVRWSGWNRQEVIGADWFERFVPETDESVRKVFFDGIASGHIASPYQNAIRTRSGELRMVLWHNTVLRDAAGRPVGSASIGEDVTDRQRAAAALERSEREFKVLFDHNPMPMYVFDRGTLRFLAVNDATVKHYGYAREEFLVMSLEEIRPPEDRAALRQVVANRSAGLVNAGTWSHIKRDGTRILMEISAHPIEFQGVAAELVLAKDVTAQRAGEAALRASEERFRQITESIREVFWLTSPDKTQIFYVSPGYATVWGRGPLDLMSNPAGWFEAIHPDDRERIRNAIPMQLVPDAYAEEYRIVRPDGSMRWILDRAFPVYDAFGAVYRVAGVAEDITERKRLEEQFRQAQKMEAVGQLSAGVAHDFNNLLTVIKGHIGLLNVRQQLPAEIKASVEGIAEAADRAANLTRQLLTFSRQEEMRIIDLNLNGLVANVSRMLRRLVDESIAMEVSLSAEPLPIRADEGMIDQVLLNLVVNARDAMPKGGSLRISTTRVDLDESGVRKLPQGRSGAFACVAVEDTGTGIAPAVVERIFEPFFTTKAAGKGTGLGLATVYGIVRQHDGWIDVESAVGRGTTFRVYLPRLATPRREALELKSPTPVRGGHEGILIVEDDAAVRDVAVAVLADLGYRAYGAASGDEAIQLWRAHRDNVRLLLTDMVLPGGISGRELADRLRSSVPSLAVVFMSGYTHDHPEGEAATRDGYLAKPFDWVSLARVVRESLDRIAPH